MERWLVVNYRKSVAGLTLIEVLIALAIISIAMTAIIKAASQNIRSTDYLQQKSAAMWVAQSVLSEAQAGLIGLSDTEDANDNVVSMLGNDWHWRGSVAATANTHMQKVTISVFNRTDDEATPVAGLEGFVYVR